MKPILYAAVDLLAGRVVRLRKGERSSAKIYSEDPAHQARQLVEDGVRALHVVDLDAAFGERRQLATLREIVSAASSVPVQIGGGIRALADVESTLATGAARAILGTAVVERPQLAAEAVREFGPDRIAAAIDVKDGKAATRGWTDARGPAASELASRLAGFGVEWLVVTAVARDGTLEGFDLPLLRDVCGAAPSAAIVASGGAGSVADLKDLAAARLPRLAGAIAGTAIYEKRFTVREGQAALEMRSEG
ncbi:MAG TPA: 1-(5-phosphoribosyl)-5-[(5-phosphoribosylamino)methylideneamino] imidazole-4-carboxamide isomerase [Myxococcales bacterium]|nr:1-(5-phosphoribosyl)-5-[(5-phosphoribosylamino)methylideneamino] imidazole-4-carboxamide isomerase [Myxococcales bacterium]